jgi:hypothetical protein
VVSKRKSLAFASLITGFVFPLAFESKLSTLRKNKARHFRARLFLLSGWQDSNLRPSGPKPDALTGLRYTPKKLFKKKLCQMLNRPDSYRERYTP